MSEHEPPTASLPGDFGSGPATPGPGETIGPYKLLGVLGSGGFGVVYEAEQTEPIRRRVALKIIKPGMDSVSVIARFEAERQALAVMEHPCIAKVFDGGVTSVEQGSRPYFVMELVRGVPITDHCDTQQFTLDERVELFIKVCEAVQHAHAKGVVHRDLKPSNVLVGYDAAGHANAKVIDFGVAKALNQRLTEATIFTDLGQMIGTPEYMSPEQAEMSGQDIDTRADVYSLGVLLYELLTGVLPFDPKELRKAAFAEIQRIIRESEPPKPSTRLSTMVHDGESAERIQQIVRARKTDTRAMSGVLRRDLDWVVMRCLEKDRSRRYQTAMSLGEELQRYLDDEPVEAGPPGLGYRAGKFVYRHRKFLTVLGGLLLIGGLGLVGTLRGYAFGESEQRRAELWEGEMKAIESSLAAMRGLSTTALERRSALDAADRSLRAMYEARPDEEIERRLELMVSANREGDILATERHATRAVELLSLAGRTDTRQAVDALNGAAVAMRRRGHFEEALDYADRARAAASGLEDDALSDILSVNRAIAARYLGLYDEAESDLRESWAWRSDRYGPQSGNVSRVLAPLAFTLSDSGRAVDAERLLTDALASSEWAERDRNRLENAMVECLLKLGSWERADTLAGDLLSRMEEAPSSQVLAVMQHRIRANIGLGAWEVAEELCDRSIGLRLEQTGGGDARLLENLATRVRCLDELGRHAEARALLTIAKSEAAHQIAVSETDSVARDRIQAVIDSLSSISEENAEGP